ncbi:MAG: multi-sensor signal transduction histidine kinase, partial [Verrucomicrobiales bacterium]|nr:multi-sensor signal transduction histidine kinase [Verrucomicrobiales bacterium]
MRAAVKDQLLCELEQQRTVSDAEIQWLRKTRQELEDSRNRLSALYDNAPVAYVTLDKKGRIQGLNETASRLLGYPQNKILQLPFTFLVGRDEVNSFLTYLDRCHRSDASKVVIELKLRTRSRKPIPVQLVSVSYTQGGTELFQTAIIDLTDRKQNELALEQAKAFAESIVETVHDPLVVLNEEFKIVSV